MKRYAHGENSITYTMFTHFDEHQLARLVENAEWIHRPKLKRDEIEAVHLFPSFGRKYGYGEPDAIIIASELVLYVEVEMADFSKQSYPTCFIRQMRKFIALANDLSAKGTTRLLKTFEGASGYKFYGRQRLRRLFEQIRRSPRRPAFLVMSDGKQVNLPQLATSLNIPNEVSLGWIGFPRLKRMKGIRPVVEVIKHNLVK